MFFVASDPRSARAQLQFTEVMSEPGGDDNLGSGRDSQYIECGVNLDGWVFDDDDDATINAMVGANIKAANGNTIVRRAAWRCSIRQQLGLCAAGFTDAWGSGINLIPVVGFTSLTAMDSIGLWPVMRRTRPTRFRW